MSEAKKLKKEVVTIMPNLYGIGTTTWTAKPNEHGGVELNYQINR